MDPPPPDPPTTRRQCPQCGAILLTDPKVIPITCTWCGAPMHPKEPRLTLADMPF